MRWADYYLRKGEELQAFWKDYLNERERNVLFILGMGFDPRMCIGYESLLKAGGIGARDCIIAKFIEGNDSPTERYKDKVQANMASLEKLVPAGSSKQVREIKMWSKDNRRITSRSAGDFFSDIIEFEKYTDVIIDVSAMPRTVFFSLIGKALTLLDIGRKENQNLPNLFVIVSENAFLDSSIKDAGPDEDANYLRGFTSTLEHEAFAGLPKIWIPTLGENQAKQLSIIAHKVAPEEICPILPMPSADPRRTDNLLVEYNELLFLEFIIEPRNFMYVAEQNPFDIYRAIYNTVYRYKAALETLGGCQVVLSPSSSKLLSIGALLAAYELKDEKVGVINVETRGYEIEGDISGWSNRTILFGMWLSGDCYRT